MNYIELKINTNLELAEILIAELGEIGFESFTESDEGINAFILKGDFSENAIQEIFERYQALGEMEYSFSEIEKQNWNAEWEKNYPPIRVGNHILVRASFHDAEPNIPFEVIINPKMSFGTGHHETTEMMMAHQLEIDHKGKNVLDVGCGTGILSVLAEKLGASLVIGFDIEEWAATNAQENIALNNCVNIQISQGTIQDEPLYQYEIVLANINRNILLDQIPIYLKYMAPNSILAVSGFYLSDQPDIEACAHQFGLKTKSMKSKNNWACVVFERE